MEKLLKIFNSHKEIMADSFWVFIGISGSQLILLVSLPLITRAYSPEDYGVYQLVQNYAAFIVGLISLKVHVYFVSVKDKKDYSIIVNLTFFITLLLTFFLLVLYFTISTLDLYEVDRYIFITAFFLSFLTLARESITYIFQNQKLFLYGAYLKLMQASIFLISIVIVFVSDKLIPVEWLYILSALFSLLAISLWKKKRLTEGYEYQTVRRMRTYWKNHKLGKMLGGLTLTHIVTSGGNLAVITYIGFTFGEGRLGLYTLALTIAFVPVSLLGNALGSVFFQRMSSRRENAKFLMDSYLKTIFILGVIACIVFIPIILLAPFFFPYFFGAEWNESIYLIQLLCVSAVAGMLSKPVDKTPIILSTTWYYPLTHGTRLTLSVILIYIHYKNNFSFEMFIELIVAINVFFYLIDLLGFYFLYIYNLKKNRQSVV